MSKPRSNSPKFDAAKLVREALRGEPRVAIERLLEAVAKMADAYGCILWRCTRDSEPNAEPPRGQMTMLASWFPDGHRPSISRLPIADTVAGSVAWRREKWCCHNDLAASGIPSAKHPFLVALNITKAAAQRFDFESDEREKRVGSLTLYRQSTAPDFDEAVHRQFLKRVCEVLPSLYRAARQRTGYELLRKVAEISRKYKPAPNESETRVRRNDALRDICKALGDTFHPVETSIYLQDPHEIGRFMCARTSTMRALRVALDSDKTRYVATLENGASGLALWTKKCIRLRDTNNDHEDIAELKRLHPGFQGRVRRGHADIVIQDLQLDRAMLPPFALIVQPLIDPDTEQILGFLRCWVVQKGPSHFVREDEGLMKLVADSLAHLILRWQEEDKQQIETAAWQRLSEEGAGAGEYTQAPGVGGNVLIQALRLVEQTIPDAEINTVRLIETDTNQLAFHAYPTAKACKMAASVHKQLMGKRYDITDPPQSIAARVVQTGQGELVSDVTTDPLFHRTFPGVKQMIVVPIVADREIIGVLDVRSIKSEPFAPFALKMATLAARILGMNYSWQRLREQSWQQRQWQADQDRKHREALENVAHQMKGPLHEALHRVKALVEAGGKRVTDHELGLLRALLRRSALASKIVGITTLLAAGKRIPLSSAEVRPADWVELLTELCQNQEIRISYARTNIRIRFDHRSFYRRAPIVMRADSELLAQALDNVLDNAVKYSYPSTTIEVACGMTNTGNFAVTVTNEGIPIRPGEVALAKTRSWRSDHAKVVTGEGNGIGLWVVDELMKAHGG